MTDPIIDPIEPAPGTQPTQPNWNSLNSSGDGASGVQDWYVHVQTVDIMYLRKNQYDTNTSSTVSVPNALSNYLDVHYTVQTIDEVYEDASYSGSLSQPHYLELLTAVGTSGGFGVCGVINTSSAGVIRRPVRKDAAGNILDTTGVCTESGNLVIDQMPGAYAQGFDTSAQVNANVLQMMGSVSVECPTFFASLVAL